MKALFRRRSLPVAALVVAATGMVSMGCGSAPKVQPKQAQAPKAQPAAQARSEATAQADAQRSWCSYLEALYLRAAPDAKHWPKLGQCMQAQTMASPEMLKRTAECSRAALEKFEGDPFTSEYAAEVSRCGAAALDAVSLGEAEIGPYVAAICSRMASCGESSYEDCREGLQEGLGPHLERALGAMNRRGRNAFQVCLKRMTCGDLGTQVVGCLEPIMDDLLWLPG